MSKIYAIVSVNYPIYDPTTQIALLCTTDNQATAEDSLEMYMRQLERGGYEFMYRSANGFPDEPYYEEGYHFENRAGKKTVLKLIKNRLS